MKAADKCSYPSIQEDYLERKGTTLWGTVSIPLLPIHQLTNNSQRDAGEELSQLWGEPNPHTEQPH
jgi:hypothetical protein